jgi:hypothetical protein
MKTSKVQRYSNWKSRTMSSTMYLDRDGEYVLYSEYEKLHEYLHKVLVAMARYKDKRQYDRFDIEELKKELSK